MSYGITLGAPYSVLSLDVVGGHKVALTGGGGGLTVTAGGGGTHIREDGSSLTLASGDFDLQWGVGVQADDCTLSLIGADAGIGGSVIGNYGNGDAGLHIGGGSVVTFYTNLFFSGGSATGKTTGTIAESSVVQGGTLSVSGPFRSELSVEDALDLPTSGGHERSIGCCLSIGRSRGWSRDSTSGSTRRSSGRAR